MNICSCQDELPMFWRLLQGAEQGIKRLGREHVDFINNENFVLGIHGCILNHFPKITNFINSPV